MLLSIDRASVRCLAGNILYEEDLAGFLKREFPSGGPPEARKAPWFALLSRQEMPFCISLVATLVQTSEDNVPGCLFLERFSRFYSGHRSEVQLAARELRLVLDGLFALQQAPALFATCMDSMGPLARVSLPRGVALSDVGSFLGRLMIGAGRDQISLAELPSVVRGIRQSSAEEAQRFLQIPHRRRMLETLERSAESVAPLLDRLRAAW
ncbi:MAG TPA: hypothetical protein VLY04_04880 [Bryobacteraceae bacterium]|nr:hypothetical protein [Bryobacteraceae bacterium]